MKAGNCYYSRRGNVHSIIHVLKIEDKHSHFTGRARSYSTNYIEVSEYLNSDKKIKACELKKKLLKENLIKNKCAICGLTEWQNKPITLQLHHIDGNPNNNCLDNLQLLCPNCHSQTDNYCGSANVEQPKYYCKDCGKEITRGAIYCTVCSRKHSRKVEDRPSKEQLLKDFKELKSFVKVGNKYEVSDNAVRKWIKAYDLPSSAKEIKELVKNI